MSQRKTIYDMMAIMIRELLENTDNRFIRNFFTISQKKREEFDGFLSNYFPEFIKEGNPKEISYDLMAEDTIAFIKELKISKPTFYGFSDGGIIGLLVSIKEPELLSNLIISGANISPDVFTTFDMLLTKLFYFFTRSKFIKMMLDEPNIPLEDLQKISIPVHVLAGEKYVIKLEHTKLIANNIKNSTLEIIKCEKHGSYIIHRSGKKYNFKKNSRIKKQVCFNRR